MKDLKIKVGPIGLLDMLKFKNQVKTRDKVIEKGQEVPVQGTFKANQTAAMLHPAGQNLVIKEIITHTPDVKTFVFASANGSALAPFQAGQYLSFTMNIDGSLITRPISICSSPKDAQNGKYAITVKRAGFASDWLLDTAREGDTIAASAPLGIFTHSSLRDADYVVALAGGSGITPFLSMAKAIAEGSEDFHLTLLYGSRTEKDILFKKELDELEAKSLGKVKVVHVLSHEDKPGFEKGFLTRDLIAKYMGDGPASIYICGPQVMYEFVSGELKALGIERKWIRRELFGASRTPWLLEGYPQEHKDQTYNISVHQYGKEQNIKASANESVLTALERAGISAPSRCRSGECGWCRSRLISGNVFIPDVTDGRRAADKLYGYIHPCASYPLGDLVIELLTA